MKNENIVYVIDSDQDTSRSLAALLSNYDTRVVRFDDAGSFLTAAQSIPTKNSSLILQLELSDKGSMAALRQIRSEQKTLPIIAICDCASEELVKTARDSGATYFIEKSLGEAYLFQRIAELVPGADSIPYTESSSIEMEDGKHVTFRMAHPQDADLYQEFITDLSDNSRYMRFFSGLKKLPDHALKEFTNPQFPDSFAVVAIVSDGEEERQIGVARWVPSGTEGIGEFALVVADDCHGQGIASKLMRLLISAATLGQLRRIEGHILKKNVPMLTLVKKMGFDAQSDHDAGPSIAMYAKNLRETAA